MSANAWSHLAMFFVGFWAGFLVGLAVMVHQAIKKIKIGP